MPAADYVAMASHPHVLGDPLLKTQHFIGASKWEKISDTEAIGWHQLRVPYQRYTDDSKMEVSVEGHAHDSNQHWYRKVEGVWKFAGLAVEIRWAEFDLDQVFASGRDTFGEEESVKVEKVKHEIGIMTGVNTDVVAPPAKEEKAVGADRGAVDFPALDDKGVQAKEENLAGTDSIAVDLPNHNPGTEVPAAIVAVTEDAPTKMDEEVYTLHDVESTSAPEDGFAKVPEIFDSVLSEGAVGL